MDTDQLIELIPHYLALLILLFVTLWAVQTVVGEVGFWVEFAIVLVAAFAYRPIVVSLGIGPSSWEK
jgi:hypothetical protein